MSGFSITLVFGAYAGFYIRLQSYSWRVCLGWVAFTVYPRTDIESYITHLRKEEAE